MRARVWLRRGSVGIASRSRSAISAGTVAVKGQGRRATKAGRAAGRGSARADDSSLVDVTRLVSELPFTVESAALACNQVTRLLLRHMLVAWGKRYLGDDSYVKVVSPRTELQCCVG